jgi:hypothetical protein
VTARAAPVAPGRPVPARAAAAAALLGAACVIWSAIPLNGGLATAVLCAAAVFAALGAVRLWLPPPAEAGFPGALAQLASALGRLVRGLPWAEATTVAVLVAEALHRSPPWHTALLGVALLAYLFAVHLAESRGRLAVLRPQVPLLAAGLGLLVLATCAALLPAAAGSAAALMAGLAALAAIVVAGLALTR